MVKTLELWHVLPAEQPTREVEVQPWPVAIAQNAQADSGSLHAAPAGRTSGDSDLIGALNGNSREIHHGALNGNSREIHHQYQPKKQQDSLASH
ncbi:hypothetical protein ABBQ32_005823 [Trebouxia sp. C0010 RCD-2024]